MLELPEVLTLAKQLQNAIVGKAVAHVLPPTKKHKFCWFSGNPAEYDKALKGGKVQAAEGFGMFAEIIFDNGLRLCVDDGVNIRLISAADAPKDYQLMIKFDDSSALVFTVAMYGGIVLHNGFDANEYYHKSRRAVSPFSEDFGAHFRRLLTDSKPTLSAKAFLATEQRFPGIGNGVLQDILFEAGINPKRKIATFTEQDIEKLLSCIARLLREMIDLGGRDTEKDLFGNFGGYKTKMSKNGLAAGCPVCDGEIIKEAYLGGSVYYCPSCQK